MRLTIADVVAQLRAGGLATAEEADTMRATLMRASAEDIPWYMRAAVGAGAWAATAFLLAFLFGLDILEGDVTRIVFGVILIAGALYARRDASAEFMRQASVAARVAGQGLIIIGLGEASDSPMLAGAVGIVLSVAMIRLMPDGVHRFLSVLIGAGSAVAIVVDFGWRYGLEMVAIGLIILAAFVWRVRIRQRSAKLGEMLDPVGYGVVVAVFAFLVYSAATGGRIGIAHGQVAALGVATTAVLGVLLIALVASVLRECGASSTGPTALIVFTAIVLLAIVTRSSPGIIAGVAVLVLAFDRRNPVLLGMAGIFLTVFGSVYYYSLSLTLIEKAGVLAASGALLLVARALLARQRPPAEVPA